MQISHVNCFTDEVGQDHQCDHALPVVAEIGVQVTVEASGNINCFKYLVEIA